MNGVELTQLDVDVAAETFAELVRLLDSRYERWDCHRTCTGSWFFRGEQDGQEHDADGDTLIDAMYSATSWVPLPMIPRQPERFCRDAFAAVKRNGKWLAQYEGRDFYASFKTKKAAEAFFDQVVKTRQNEYEAWFDRFGCWLHKTEGVHFRYEK